MNAYQISYKKHATARKVQTWTRFAESEEAARESALRALDYEFYGKAVLVSVKITADPRSGQS